MGGPSPRHRDDLIIITSSLGRVLRGAVNAQRVKALLGDMEHFVVSEDVKVCLVWLQWGKSTTSLASVWIKNAPERSMFCLL